MPEGQFSSLLLNPIKAKGEQTMYTRPFHSAVAFINTQFCHKYEFLLENSHQDSHVSSVQQKHLFISKQPPPNCDILVFEFDPTQTHYVNKLSDFRRSYPTIPCILIATQAVDMHANQVLQSSAADCILVNPTAKSLLHHVSTLTTEYAHLQTNAPAFHNPFTQTLNDYLDQLCMDTSACGSLLIKSDGYYLYRGNVDATVDMQSISSLIAANIGAANQLVSLLGSQDDFQSNYHFNGKYGIYSCFVFSGYMISVIFKEDNKLGTIRFYTHKMAEQIKHTVREFDEINQRLQSSVVIPDISQLVSDELDQLFQGAI